MRKRKTNPAPNPYAQYHQARAAYVQAVVKDFPDHATLYQAYIEAKQAFEAARLVLEQSLTRYLPR